MVATKEPADAFERFIRQGPLRVWRYRHIAGNEAQDLASQRVLAQWVWCFEAVSYEVVEQLMEESRIRWSRSPNGVADTDYGPGVGDASPQYLLFHGPMMLQRTPAPAAAAG